MTRESDAPFVLTDPPKDAVEFSRLPWAIRKQAADPQTRMVAMLANKLAVGDKLNAVEEALLGSAEFAQARSTLAAGAVKRMQEAQGERVAIEKDLKALETIDAWYEHVAYPIKLQKPSGPMWHKLLEALGERRVTGDAKEFAMRMISAPFEPVSFLIEHDWAAAFRGAGDFDGGEPPPMPHAATLFEMRTCNAAVLYLVLEDTSFCLVGAGDSWLIAQGGKILSDTLFSYLREQAKAVCIALDAGVVVREMVRAPDKLNVQRTKRGRPPLMNYHVLKLAHRVRAASLPSEHELAQGYRHRLHFVRGHWRRYQSHKTWIKWHLRGDPDLGFIDKHYRV